MDKATVGQFLISKNARKRQHKKRERRHWRREQSKTFLFYPAAKPQTQLFANQTKRTAKSNSIFQFRFTRITDFWFIGRITASICASRALQPNHENADVGG